jgi:hypothetical protein
MQTSNNTSSSSSGAGGFNPVEVFQNALDGQPDSGTGDVANPYGPIIDAMTAPDVQGPASDAYPLAIQGLLSGGESGRVDGAPSVGALSPPGSDTTQALPPLETSALGAPGPSLAMAASNGSDDNQPDSDTPSDAETADSASDAGSVPAAGEPRGAPGAGDSVATPQSPTLAGRGQPPRLTSAGTANGLGIPPAVSGKTPPRGPGTAAGKGPPKVPDYSHFSQVYSDWAKSHSDAPRYVPASGWKKIAPDPAKLEPESKYGPYSRITFHHTGSDVTPQAVDELQTNHEPFLHHLQREVAHGFHAEKYDFGDVGYHFLIGEDGTIYEGRPLSYQGAHVWHHDPANIGVAFLGDYSSKGFSDAQIHSARALIRVLNHAYGIGQGANGQQYIFTHRDLAPPKGKHARPEEFVGTADQQMNQIKAWSQTRGPGN